jgi:tRNA-specific 2-thiouridylase
LQKGRFVDINGNDLGECKGVSAYTVGQRRGLGLSMPHPPYVLELRPDDNTVVIGKEEMLYSKSLTAKNINLIAVDALDVPIRAQVKIRYSDPGHIATVRQTDDDTLHIEFDEPQRAIAKGQSAVIYDGDIVIGGGVID